MTTTFDSIVDKCLAESNIRLKQTCQSKHLFLHRAVESDMESVLELVHGLAVYEKEPDAVKVNADTYVRDGFRSSPPLFHCILLIDQHSGKKCGMGLWYIGYSTLEGPFLYLEDLFILKEYRGVGAGTCIMRTLANICISLQCKKFVWQALDWNTPALDFYRNINAIVLPDRTLRMDRVAIENFLLSFQGAFLNGAKMDSSSNTTIQLESLNSDSLHKAICLSIDKVNSLLSKQTFPNYDINLKIGRIFTKDSNTILPLLKNHAKSLNEASCEVNFDAFLLNNINGMSPVYHCITIEDIIAQDHVGFCVWYFGYSTWEGRTIQISDIYIKDKMVEPHMIKYIMYTIASLARLLDCGRLVWNEGPRKDSDAAKERVCNDIGAVTLNDWLTLNMIHSSILEFVKS